MTLSKTVSSTLAIATLCLTGCSKDDSSFKQPKLPEKEIVILYDNDVHCQIDGYPKLVTLRNALLKQTPYISTVSCGDFASGSIMGIASQGEDITTIMNQVDYDVVVIGNHELDYGMEQMFNLCNTLEAKVVCANLINCQSEQHLFPAYHIQQFGDVNVAFVGLTTTTSGTIKDLSDSQGNPLYSFMQDGFYENAQHHIDQARRAGADYVVVLAHLGDNERIGHPSSISLIANTRGVDAVIDGHDHDIITERLIANKEGKPVLLTSSGANFANIGKLSIRTDGTLRSELIDADNTQPDPATQQFVDKIKEEALAKGNFSVGYSEVELSIYDAEENRIVRTQECNIGDFCADAFRQFTSADIALINGGGIRASIARGDVTLNNLYDVMPFCDRAYVGIITGKELLNALEIAVHALPEEDGVFMQVSGLKFTIDPSIPSPVTEEEQLLYVGEGPRRISDVQILNRASGEYEAVDVKREYTMASLDYLILELGGSGIFRQVKPVKTYWGSDIEVLKHYISDSLDGKIGTQYATPQGRILFK